MELLANNSWIMVVVAIFILAIVAAILGRRFSLGFKTKEYFFGFEIGDRD